MGYQFKPIEPPPGIAISEWENWKWQVKHSLKSEQDYQKYFDLSRDEKRAFDKLDGIFRIQTTPYYASLADRRDPADPIRQILIPNAKELSSPRQSLLDPLGERVHNPAPRVIHRYSDRVLFLITDFCGVYCRYCTRKHFTGQDQVLAKSEEYQSALKYIASKPQIREVILSGGDPLTLSDGILERVLHDLRKIPSVEIIRVGSRQPVVNPYRVTDDLLKALRQHKPVFLMTHFNHPQEISMAAAEALEKFVDHGVPVFNQMVLLNGINNHPAVVQALSRRLLFLRVKPYYMFHCDPSQGTDHFQTSVEDSKNIQRELWGHLSGLAMPNLSLDIPNGGGKVPLVPNFEVDRDEKGPIYKGWDGTVNQYVEPPPSEINRPKNIFEYEEEWRVTTTPYRIR